MKHIIKSASSVALILAGVVASCLLLKVGADLAFGNSAGWKAWIALGVLFLVAESIAAARSDSAARRRSGRHNLAVRPARSVTAGAVMAADRQLLALQPK